MDKATSNMVATFLGGLVRHGLTTAGGYLAANGFIGSSDEQAFVGAGMIFAGLAWSWWQKYGQAKVVAQLQALAKKA